MNQSKISVRYAKALLSFSVDKNITERIKEDMTLVYEICRNDKSFTEMLDSPVIKNSEKRKIINNAFSAYFHQISIDFIDMILSNNREIFIESIARNFLDLYREYKGIKNAEIKSVIPLDNDTAKRIKTILEEKFKCKIELNEKVEKELIGGFTLRVEDQQIDASIATQLNKIRKELMHSN